MILVNGVQTDTVFVNDRGLMYGDGVFRTLLMQRGLPLWWDDHYDKLNADCAALKIACPAKEVFWQALQVISINEPECVVKIIVTRGQGARGYVVDASMQPTYVVSTSQIPHHPENYRKTGVKVRLCDLRLSTQPLLAGIKHLNRLENVLARMEWDDASIAEGVLLDERGNVICGTMTNLVLVKDGALIVPDLALCGVAGVTRHRIMAWAIAQQIPVSVQTVSISLLMDADEVMLCNSVIGVWQVAEFNGRNWAAGNMTKTIRHALHD